MDQMDFRGQTLDGKYRIERELGRGGMGTVYLATHLGTERPVAVKIIAPQYMKRGEFVERFRREARAAGRLRHPNVVNVTDFGFSEARGGRVAFLVMEYLDGCTLGEILDEERNLPVGWTLEILEQVCSAVHEAHQQGIIHRDLKPDNIWLEPNQRGGYTVKVLDFGIAKLEEHDLNGHIAIDHSGDDSSVHTVAAGARATALAAGREAGSTLLVDADTIVQTFIPETPVSESETLQLDSVASEGETAILVDSGGISIGEETEQTPIDVSIPDRTAPDPNFESTGELTKVGAVLGTPLYMSPEQCRGDHLDARSDIYSLGVIAYQMLSGAPPFQGDFKDVMESHKSVMPTPLKTKQVRRKLKRVILSTLSKDPDERPQTAEAFASELRSRSEGIFGLLRRALVIYSEHLPKFLLMTGFFSIPMIVLTVVLVGFSFLMVSDIISADAAGALIAVVGVALSIATAFCTNLIVGTIAWIVTQHLSVPLRPVRLRPAMGEARKKWKRMAGAGFLTAVLPVFAATVGAVLGFFLLGTVMLAIYPATDSVASIFIGGGIGAVVVGALVLFALYVVWILVPAVIVMENVGVFNALHRSITLVKRSFGTATGAVIIMFLIPVLIVGAISYVVKISGKALDPKSETQVETVAGENGGAAPPEVSAEKEEAASINFSLGRNAAILVDTDDKTMHNRLKTAILESLIQVLWLPMQIFVFSFSGIIVALLYLKTRLAGGESMNDLIERFEDDGSPRKKWQERVRKRLMQSGRISGKS